MTALDRANDEEIGCYLLQLVQALRYADSGAADTCDRRSQDLSGSTHENSLESFLISRAVQSPQLATLLHYFLTVELSLEGGSQHDSAEIRDARACATCAARTA